MCPLTGTVCGHQEEMPLTAKEGAHGQDGLGKSMAYRALERAERSYLLRNR